MLGISKYNSIPPTINNNALLTVTKKRRGNYIPDSTSHSRKRHEKPIPPPAKVAFNPLILRVDDSELAFLHQIATQRGADAGDKVQITIKINEFLRELLHAGMIAHERKKET